MRNRRLLTLFILVLSSTHAVHAQIDSSKYYRKIISNIYRENYESLRKDPRLIEATNNFQRFMANSNIYSSFTIFGAISDVSYDKLNTDIAQRGYPAIKAPLVGIGVGTTHEYYNRWVLEFLILLGLDNRSKNGDSTLKVSYTDMVQVNFGYDFIKSRKINIYPYAGLGLRVADLNYKASAEINNNYTSVVDIVRADRSVYTSKISLCYQAGVNFDLVIHEGNKGSGTMLFLRAGTDGNFGNTTFKIDGVKYDPQLKQGTWQLAFGFKFFGRN
jgi:hypothetical protein